ncbi:MAG: asparagine synthase C-terminal domain-containing protein, partial [Pseudomonadota bacterium]
LTLRYVPAPLTMVAGIRKFPAAHHAVARDGRLDRPVRWWDIAIRSGPGGVTAEQRERLDWLLDDAVRLCLRSDVPYGAFLSGGVDSGLVTALMARRASEPVRTFSIGFAGTVDERPEAEAVARALGTRHHSFELAPADLRRLPRVACMVDEPFPDPIVLAMDLLAEHASSEVKVILTGEGADELFGGYVHHPTLRLLGRLSPALVPPLPAVGAAMARALPDAVIDRLFNYPVPPGSEARQRLAGLLREARSDVGRTLAYVSLFDAGDRDRLLTPDARAAMDGSGIGRFTSLIKSSSGAFPDRLWTAEYKTWLADNILFKQDKTLMAHSVEGRVPFCDHRLVELAAGLPMAARLKAGINKAELRAAAQRLAPDLPAARAKKAFMVPFDGAYGAEIRQLAGDLLGSGPFAECGLFRKDEVDLLVRRFATPTLLGGKKLLALVMLALWQREVLAP